MSKGWRQAALREVPRETPVGCADRGFFVSGCGESEAPYRGLEEEIVSAIAGSASPAWRAHALSCESAYRTRTDPDRQASSMGRATDFDPTVVGSNPTLASEAMPLHGTW